jgi:hypothetical protein
VLLDLSRLPEARIEVELSVEAKRRTDVLVFPAPAGRLESVRGGEAEAEVLAAGEWVGLRLPAPLEPGGRCRVAMRTLHELAPEDLEDLFTLADPRFRLPLDFSGGLPVRAAFRTPEGEVVVSNGAFEGESAADGRRETVWTVPASPKRTLFLRVEGRLFRHAAQGVDFLLACPPGDEAAVRKTLDLLADATSFLEALYGPRESRRLAVAATPAADRMGTRFNAGGLVCLRTGDLRDPDDPWLGGCFAHEIAHEWWGGLVFGSKDDRQVLTECLAEFSSIHYQEKRGGPARAFEDVIVNTVAYLEGDRKAVSETGDDLYSKSILTYRHLLHVAGEKAFFEAAREVLKANAGRQVSHRAFFEAAGKAAGRDVQWLLDWLYHTDADLDFAVESLRFEEREGKRVTRIEFAERVGRFDYPLEVPVRIETEDGTVSNLPRRIGRGAPAVVFMAETWVRSVSVDPDGMLWDVDRSNNYFGLHAVASKPSPRDPAASVQVVGFRSPYRDRFLASAWVRTGAWASLVPLGDRRLEAPPLAAWAVDGTVAFLAFPGDEGTGLRMDGSGDSLRVLPVVPGGPWAGAFREALEKDLAAAEAESRKEAEALARRWAEGDPAAAVAEMDRVSLDEPGPGRGKAVLFSCAAFLYLSEPRPQRAREAAFRLIAVFADLPECAALRKRNVKVLVAALDDPSPWIRHQAAFFLRDAPSPEAVEPLCRSLLRDPANVNGQAIFALEAIGDPRAVPALVRVLEAPNLWDRRNAAAALASMPDRRSVEPLIRALEKEDPATYSESERRGMVPQNPDPARRAFGQALRAITGKDFGSDAKAWRAWWEGEGKRAGGK